MVPSGTMIVTPEVEEVIEVVVDFEFEMELEVVVEKLDWVDVAVGI